MLFTTGRLKPRMANYCHRREAVDNDTGMVSYKNAATGKTEQINRDQRENMVSWMSNSIFLVSRSNKIFSLYAHPFIPMRINGCPEQAGDAERSVEIRSPVNSAFPCALSAYMRLHSSTFL